MDDSLTLPEQLIHAARHEGIDVFFPLLWRKGLLLKPEERVPVLTEIRKHLPDNPVTEGRLLLSEGFRLLSKGNYTEVFEKLLLAIEKFRSVNDEEGAAAALTVMAVGYISMGQLEKAQNNLMEAIDKLSENGAYAHFLKISYYQAGEVHILLKDYPTAVRYFENGTRLSQDDPVMTGRMLNGIGTIHFNTGELDKALEYFQRSLEQVRDTRNFLLESRNLADIGMYYSKTGQTEKAIEYLEKSLEIRLTHKQENAAITNYLLLADLFYNQKNYSEALNYANLALALSDKVQIIIKLHDIHEMLYKVYEAMGDDKKAFSHFKSYHAFKENVYSQETARKVKHLSMSHEVELMSQEKEIFRLRNVELKYALDNIGASISYARRLQEALLPNKEKIDELLKDYFILYKPKDIVSGDFYWLENRGKIYFAAIDCTGHGVPGAIVSVICHTCLNRVLNEYQLSTPSEILDKTRELIIETFAQSNETVKDGMDIALCSFSEDMRSMEYAGANNPVYILRNNELSELKADKQPIGHHPEMTPFTNHKVELKKGDLVYLFSDGYADQFGGDKGKKFKYAQFKETLLKNHRISMQLQKEALDRTFEDWKGNFEQVDDVLVAGILIS